jgi:beta-lactamase regulating signal transducer with metallopeptidase domain
MVWISGVGFGLFVLLTGLVRLARVASASTTMRSERWRRLTASISSEYGLNRIVHLLESRNPSVLVTWGAVSPKIILPARSAEWPEDRAGIVLRHELAHVRRRDWILHMFAQTLRIVFWFNPLVWIVCRRLRLESECACDDLVLTNIQGHEYAAHLLDLARVLNRPGQFGLQRYRWHAHPP